MVTYLCLALLWTAPELLRDMFKRGLPDPEGSQAGDVYSFAIIVHEIIYQKGVFGEELNSQISPKGFQIKKTYCEAELMSWTEHYR